MQLDDQTINYSWQDNGQLLQRISAALLLGDVDDSGDIALPDAIHAISVGAGFQAGDLNLEAVVNKDGRLGLPEALYFMKKVSE